MTDTPTDTPIGIAPADARPHRPWPLWRKALAYAVLALVAIASIAYIDRAVVRTQPPTHPDVPAK